MEAWTSRGTFEGAPVAPICPLQSPCWRPDHQQHRKEEGAGTSGPFRGGGGEDLARRPALLTAEAGGPGTQEATDDGAPEGTLGPTR